MLVKVNEYIIHPKNSLKLTALQSHSQIRPIIYFIYFIFFYLFIYLRPKSVHICTHTQIKKKKKKKKYQP